MAFLLKALGFPVSIPNFPYTVRDDGAAWTVPLYPDHREAGEWRVCKGTSNEDGKPVMIFSCALTERHVSDVTRELARNALRRAKVLMLPGLLRCYGGTEHGGTIYIATEVCEWLRDILDSAVRRRDYYDDTAAVYEEAVALGLRDVGAAAAALHKNGLLHGHLGCTSVYVTPSGQWRLFGLELVTSLAEDAAGVAWYAQHAARVLTPYQTPPELNSTAAVGPAVDAWGMACLMYESLVDVEAEDGTLGRRLSQLTASQLRSCRRLPRRLQGSFAGLCAANPQLRHSVIHFLDSADFVNGSEYVRCMTTLEQLALQTSEQRESFLQRLPSLLPHFPRRACMSVMVARLTSSLQFGPTAAVVEPVVCVAERVREEADYVRYISPALVALYNCPDTLLRYRLLQSAARYAPRLPRAAVEQLWGPFLKGFTSGTATVREHTARAVLHFAGQLDGAVVVRDVVPALTRLQQDADGALRSNATVSLCLLAPTLPQEQRGAILLSGFTRMLRDPFTPSRLVALRSLSSALPHFSPSQIAAGVVPAVGPLTVDSVAEIRAVALELLRTVCTGLEAHHTELLRTQPESTATTPSHRVAAATTPTTITVPEARLPKVEPWSSPPLAPDPVVYTAWEDGDGDKNDWTASFGSEHAVDKDAGWGEAVVPSPPAPPTEDNAQALRSTSGCVGGTAMVLKPRRKTGGGLGAARLS